MNSNLKMRFTRKDKVKAGASPEKSEREKFIKGLLDAVNDVFINHQGSLTDTSFQQNTDRLLDAVEENYPEHLPALEHAINNPANPMVNEKQKPKWGIIASLLLSDISNDEKSQKEVLNFVTKGTSKQKGSVYEYLKNYGVDKLKKIMKNAEQNKNEQPPEPIIEDTENNSEPAEEKAKEVKEEAKKLKPKKKSSGGLVSVLEDLIKQQEEISKLDISDEVKLKRIHSIENDIIKDANLERFIVNFLKAKQELELQLNRPLIFGGAIRRFLTKDEAEAFIKARQKPNNKVAATLVHKDDTIEEKIKKIKEEDEKNKVIDKFLQKEIKKGSNQRNQEVILELASAGYITKTAKSVKTLDKVPEKVVDNKCIGILPEYRRSSDGTGWDVITEYEEGKRYENKFLFALRNYNVPEQVVRFKIPYVNGIINSRYIELESLLDRKVDEIIRQSEVDIIEDAGIKVKTKKWNDRNVIMVTNDTVFDMIAFDIDRSATKNFEQTESNIKKTVNKAKEDGKEKEVIDELLPEIINAPGGVDDLPDDGSKIYVEYKKIGGKLQENIKNYIALRTLKEKIPKAVKLDVEIPTKLENIIKGGLNVLNNGLTLGNLYSNKLVSSEADENKVAELLAL